MDIKDIILIGGGLLIAAVVVHGFWIAWKARRDPLRMDLVTNLPDDDGDDLKRLRAELPNGGARVIGQTDGPWQQHLELGREIVPAEFDDGDAPMLLEPSEPARPERRSSAGHGRKTEPRLDPAPPARPAGHDHRAAEQRPARRDVHRSRELRPGPAAAEPPPVSAKAPAAERAASRPKPASAPRRDKVKDVLLPERPEKAEASREPRRWPSRKASADAAAGTGAGSRSERAAAEPRKVEQPVEELIVVNVLAPRGKPFVGGGLVEALRARGLRYGDMNIFHRIDPMTRTSLYSVANVVEPGTFDLSDLDSFRSPGVCFFLQLPGPEQPIDVFEDMLKAAREVAVRVGGEVKDEQRSVMTGQTVEHYRQRISDFCRRRMSMRA